MRWAVYVDLSRPLSKEEQAEVFSALEAVIPDSGCVGPNRRGVHEVYFVVDDMPSREDATREAERSMTEILERAGVGVTFQISVQPMRT